MTDSPQTGSRADGEGASWRRIPLTSCLYVGATMSAAVGTFGSGGVVPGIAIVAFWGSVFRGENRPRKFRQTSIAGLVLLLPVSLLLPAISTAREAARRMHCSANLKQIAYALHNYHDLYGSLPPAYAADDEGRPTHSWRVLILPFIDEQRLYDQYRFDEPWDSLHNRTLADQMPGMFVCPSNAHRHSGEVTAPSYVAVLGADTAWPWNRGRSFGEFVDEPASTLLAMEYHGEPIEWTDPRDPTYEQAVAAFASPKSTDYGHMHAGFFYNTAYGRTIARADGSVAFVAGHLPEAMAAQLLGIDDGTPEALTGKSTNGFYRQLNHGNWLRLAIFLMVVFLPMPWVWMRPNLAGRRSADGQPRDFLRLLPNSPWGLQVRFSCRIVRSDAGGCTVRYDGIDLGPVEVTAPTRAQALEKMRVELRDRLELCPYGGEAYRDIRIELREA